MRISGFSFCRNADSLYYPIVESIKSALPIVDEFVIAVGKSDDKTLELIQSIDDSKIKIIETVWDLEKYPNGTVHAQQTDLAKSHCSGDWLLYLQADEVLHEKDFKTITECCENHLNDNQIEGFIFEFIHLWGDYHHHQNSHTWYDREIRIVRNDPSIHSWESAQSFRAIPNFIEHRQKVGTRKLRVAEIPAKIYHYGWVRPPAVMSKKISNLYQIHTGIADRITNEFSWGNLSSVAVFRDSHPAVMAKRIASFNWTPDQSPEPTFMRHRRLSARILSLIERYVFRGKKLFTFHNYILISKTQ